MEFHSSKLFFPTLRRTHLCGLVLTQLQKFCRDPVGGECG
jgi:hypothetical protein